MPGKPKKELTVFVPDEQIVERVYKAEKELADALFTTDRAEREERLTLARAKIVLEAAGEDEALSKHAVYAYEKIMKAATETAISHVTKHAGTAEFNRDS